MSINVSCQCGASFSVPEQFAGRQTACPKYKQPLIIPAVAPLPATPPPPARNLTSTSSTSHSSK